jgi:hypothetical protein
MVIHIVSQLKRGIASHSITSQEKKGSCDLRATPYDHNLPGSETMCMFPNIIQSN